MYIDRVFFPIESLGPGRRLSIWTVGCTKHCKNCANKELWNYEVDRDISVDNLYEYIIKNVNLNSVEGITITGGDPLEQFDECMLLILKLKESVKDVLVYTGYTFEELEALHTKDEISTMKRLVSVLIDGRYVDALNEDNLALRGSSNQKIYYFDKNIQNKYEKYLKEGRKIQNIHWNNRFISAGIHNKEDKGE